MSYGRAPCTPLQRCCTPANFLCVARAAAVACLWRSARAVQAVWGEALLAPKGEKLRCGAGGGGGAGQGTPACVRHV